VRQAGGATTEARAASLAKDASKRKRDRAGILDQGHHGRVPN
jgi:hypothetical protein